MRKINVAIAYAALIFYLFSKQAQITNFKELADLLRAINKYIDLRAHTG